MVYSTEWQKKEMWIGQYNNVPMGSIAYCIYNYTDRKWTDVGDNYVSSFSAFGNWVVSN